MDSTTLNTLVGIVGAIVGIIGIIVGIIGLKNVTTVIKIKNSIKADTVQHAQIIHNGLDDYAVIRPSRETTQEELKKVIETFKPLMWEEIDDIVTEKVKSTDEKVQKLKEEVNSIPRLDIHVEENESGGSTLVINGGTAKDV